MHLAAGLKKDRATEEPTLLTVIAFCDSVRTRANYIRLNRLGKNRVGSTGAHSRVSQTATEASRFPRLHDLGPVRIKDVDEAPINMFGSFVTLQAGW